MLYRLVRPMHRAGSRIPYFAQRIPQDVKASAVGLCLTIPVGEGSKRVTLTSRTKSIRFSLRTTDPSEAKIRHAAAAAYLENVWRALRERVPVSLTHRQAVALSGELYRGWARDERERTIAMEQDPNGSGWKRIFSDHLEPDEWAAVLERLEAIGANGKASDLEKTLGPLVDRLLLGRGIRRVTAETRELILFAFLAALQDAIETRKRNAEGDYRPDPKSERFPEWQTPQRRPDNVSAVRHGKISLNGLVTEWWAEAKTTGRKPSTYESYRNTMAAFVAFLGHDDAVAVSRADVVRFKDHRLVAIQPRTKRPVSPKTVKDNDLAALKTVFSWAVANGKLPSNPAEGVTIKLGKQRRLRSKGFTDAEAVAILTAALNCERGHERPKTFSAKRWVPWLCAYTGARVGELAQLRKEDVRQESEHWLITITPEAGTVKTDEARDVVLHPHLIELGFADFVKAKSSGHLFLTPAKSGDVLGPLQGLKNRLAEFVRTVVADRNVAPNHGWRHRFKTVGLEVGIEHRVLDAIQGQRPRNVAESYGEVSIRAQAAAIAKFPRFKVKGG